LGAFLPISSASTVHSRWTAYAFAEYLCSGSFPKAGGLRHQSSSWCAWLSHTPTTMPPLTSQEGIRLSYASRLPPSTLLPLPPCHPSWDLPCSHCRTQTRCCRWRVSRCPFHSLWLPRLSAGYGRLTCGVPRAFDAPALGHPPPSNRWEVSALSLTSQAR